MVEVFEVIRNNAQTLIDFLQQPRAFVLGFVTTFIVEGVGGAALAIINQLAAALEPVVQLPLVAGTQVGAAFGAVGATFISVYGALRDVFVSAAVATGPLAPITLMLLSVGTVLLLARILAAAADSVPVLASIQTFVGWP